MKRSRSWRCKHVSKSNREKIFAEILQNEWSSSLPIFEWEKEFFFTGKKTREKYSRGENRKMVEGGDSSCQGHHGGYQYWSVHFSDKCLQIRKTFRHCGSGRTSGYAWADRSTCTVAFLRRWTFAGLLIKAQGKESKIVVMSQMVTTKNVKQKEVMWQQYHLSSAVAEH